ncbi:hypothetical protein IW262DRAFT_1466364 [Armillaria fumosa]|nr:hypothetical protein IW262DRAFT_1466364 [Armillaria fumosa]
MAALTSELYICVPLKLLRPEFSALLTKPDEDDISDLIGIPIQKPSSSSIAIDERHTPKLHVRFLAIVLGKYRHDARERLSDVYRLSLLGGPGNGWQWRIPSILGGPGPERSPHCGLSAHSTATTTNASL